MELVVPCPLHVALGVIHNNRICTDEIVKVERCALHRFTKQITDWICSKKYYWLWSFQTIIDFRLVSSFTFPAVRMSTCVRVFLF